MFNDDYNNIPALQENDTCINALCQQFRSPKAGNTNKKMNYSFLSFCKTLTNKVKRKLKGKDLGAGVEHNIINLECAEILENTLGSHKAQNIDFSSSYLNIMVLFELVMG